MFLGAKWELKLIGQTGPYFNTHKGSDRGTPLSPLLFDLAGDVLSIMIERAVDSGLIRGLSDDLLEKGVSILQYADDTILLLQNNLEQARNLKFILCLFEQMPGLKINFHKSEVYFLGINQQE